MKLRVAFVVYIVLLSAIMFSCRRSQPSLVDANRAPDTELWYAPPDSTEYDYLVHLYWRGIDPDGIAVQYIWTITDTLDQGPLRWNPSQRIRDFQAGHMTTRTDTIISFTAFRNVGGVGLRKNRQAFHIASIDDNGVIDPSPAAVEFVATVQTLPRMRFATHITRVLNGMTVETSKPYAGGEVDTVGMFRPFKISYNGVTTNGNIVAYNYFPLTSGVIIDGSNEWSEDLADTIRAFPNTGSDALPSGRLRFAAQVSDDAGAESRVDAAGFTVGVVQIEVNYEPDTKFNELLSTYFVGGQKFEELIDFSDGNLDTVPALSWITMKYQGRDNPSDSTLCTDVLNECLKYQIQFTRTGWVDGGPPEGGRVSTSTDSWRPADPEDSDTLATSDSTSINMGSQIYQLRARTVDEFGKADGSPPEVTVTSNFPPNLDTFEIENYDGTIVGDGGTVTWDWWNPANYNNTVTDTLKIDVGTGSLTVEKQWFFVIKGTGHDHPKEADIGVQAWLYNFVNTNTGDPELFARASFWSGGQTTDAIADTVKLLVRYEWPGPAGPAGPNAFEQAAYASRPTYLDQPYSFSMRGRDTANGEQFGQLIFLNLEKTEVQNYFNEGFGRLTSIGRSNFFFEMTR